MTRPHFLLAPTTLIRPTEAVLPDRVDEVMATILERGAWTHPICIEATIYALLDGHHRLAAARRLGLARVPVRVFDYAEVEVASWRPDHTPTRAEVLARAAAGTLYPHKTTRHVFVDLAMPPVPLIHLREAVAPGCERLTALTVDRAEGPGTIPTDRNRGMSA